MGKKTTTRYRDADTGRFVEKGYADKHPKTTIKDTMKHSGQSDKPKKGK